MSRRLASILMLVGMLLVLCASTAYIVHEVGHDCTGEDCPVCAFIAQAHQVRRVFGMALFMLLSALFALSAPAPYHVGEGTGQPFCGTPISRKVRLND